jgi:Ala-tRNA(Pro) deacylase
MTLQKFLDNHGFVFECHEHAAVMTVAESEALVPALPGAKTKNLFLRDKKGLKHFLVTIPAASSVSLDRLSTLLGAAGLSFGSPERLLKVQFVMDQALWDAPAVQAHPLINTATMILPHDELERFLAATGHVPMVTSVPVA